MGLIHPAEKTQKGKKKNGAKQEPPRCERGPGCVVFVGGVVQSKCCSPRFLLYSTFPKIISFLIPCGRRSLPSLGM